MTEDPPPITIGAAGLTGRPQIQRPVELEAPDGYDEDGNPVWDTPRATGKAIPPACLRVLQLPEGKGECGLDCPGKQRDGGCLCDIVRAANAQGVDWSFEIDARDGFWDYDGPELDLPPPGEPLYPPIPRKVSFFMCPSCRYTNEQDPDNFHYWCKNCGVNATDIWNAPPPAPAKRKTKKRGAS